MSGLSLEYCSFGRVIDYLLNVPVADLQGNGVCKEIPGGRAATPVADGGWVFAVDPVEYIAVGVAATPDGSGDGITGAQMPRVIGSPQRMSETYRVLIVIRVTDGDPKAQSKVRARALALMSVYEYAVRVDPTLGGALHQAATIGGFAADQAAPDTEEDEGCSITLSFFVNVSNELE